MKNLLTCIILFAALPVSQPGELTRPHPIPVTPAENLFIITIDGFRWQEIYTGADADLVSDPDCTPDTASIKAQYWSEDVKERRKKLMPFLWNVIGKKGQLLGNRKYDNKVNTANLFRFSYPGYNEIFTGHTNLSVSSNRRKNNDNINVLEWLDDKEEYKGKVAVFTSWNVFPFILNEERNDLVINAGYSNLENLLSERQEMINTVQSSAVQTKGETRYDQLTFLTAKEYIRKQQPRVVFIGLGETDEFAHQGRYDLYLEQANKIDRMIAELWHYIQTTPGYKDNTTLLITTDHGRGSRDSKWTSHNTFIRGSSQTWIALLGPGIESKGEIREEQQYYQRQIAGMIAQLVGEKFNRSTASK